MSTNREESGAVRIRGIYATALTQVFLDADRAVVEPSGAIRERFEELDGTEPAAVWIEATGDRVGIGVHGDDATVPAVQATVAAVADDALDVAETADIGAVYDGTVTNERGGGAVVDLGEADGYLPYDEVDRYLETGDVVRVQVHDPEPPWSSRRPGMGTEIRIPGRYLTLVRGTSGVLSTPRDGTDQEYATLLAMMDVERPDGWGIRFGAPASDASIDRISSALERASTRAAVVDDALDDAPSSPDHERAPRQLASPFATGWVSFGRESRFALDELRREVTPTIPGHHRIKAGHNRASDVVDFVERLGVDLEAFPASAVLEQFGPGPGDSVSIEHGKPDGRRFTLGTGEVLDRDLSRATLTVRREITSRGTYDGLGVDRHPGDTATTQVAEGRLWFPTVYRDESGEPKGTYVNISTPVEVFPRTIRYVDLHVDVLKHADGRVEIVDRDELEAAVSAGHLPESLADRAADVASRVARGLRSESA